MEFHETFEKKSCITTQLTELQPMTNVKEEMVINLLDFYGAVITKYFR